MRAIGLPGAFGTQVTGKGKFTVSALLAVDGMKFMISELTLETNFVDCCSSATAAVLAVES